MKPQLKVCGITNEADALAAAQAGVAYLGYVLNYPNSLRNISPAEANNLIQRVRRLYPKVQHVGVLVAPTTQDILELTSQVELDIIQVYEPVPRAPLPIWQSIIVHDATDLAKLKPANETVVAIHCDAGLGSGQMIADDLLPRLQSELSLVLAGGIGPDNIAALLEKCLPDIVDVNSQVESAPGKKDITKIKAVLKHLDLYS